MISVMSTNAVQAVFKTLNPVSHHTSNLGGNDTYFLYIEFQNI